MSNIKNLFKAFVMSNQFVLAKGKLKKKKKKKKKNNNNNNNPRFLIWG